jgi:hypothetical protein
LACSLLLILCENSVGAAGGTESDREIQAAISADSASQQEQKKPPSISDAIRDSVPATAARFIPDISFILDLGFGWFDHSRHIEQGGHAMDENGFKLQGLEMAVSGAVDPYFRYDMYFQFAEVELEEAFLTTVALPINMQLRAGLMNAAFGRENAFHLHSWNFTNPTLMHTRFMAEEHFRGLGAELSFLIPLPWYMTVGAQMFDTKPGTGYRSSSFGTSEMSASGGIGSFADFTYTGKLDNFFALSDNWSMNWGLSGAWGLSPYMINGRAQLYGTDLFVKWRPISSGRDAIALGLTVEYMYRSTEVPGGYVGDQGVYTQLDMQFTRRWMAGLRGDYTGTISGGSPKDWMFPGWQARGSVDLTFMPTHFSKIRLQFDAGRQDGQQLYTAGFLQVEVGIGEHVAHKF